MENYLYLAVMAPNKESKTSQRINILTLLRNLTTLITNGKLFISGCDDPKQRVKNESKDKYSHTFAQPILITLVNSKVYYKD